MDTWAHTLDLNTVHLLCATPCHTDTGQYFAFSLSRSLSSSPYLSTSLFLRPFFSFFYLYAMINYKHLCDMVAFFGVFFRFCHFCFSVTWGCKCDSNHGETSILTQRIGSSVRFKFVPSLTLEPFHFHCKRKQFALHVISFRICSWLNFFRGSGKRYPATPFVVALFHTSSYVCYCAIHSPKWNEKSTKFFK